LRQTAQTVQLNYLSLKSFWHLQHIKAAHEAVQPVTAALLQAYPQQLQPSYFDWDAFLWVIMAR